jgi:hypothetical protein
MPVALGRNPFSKGFLPRSSLLSCNYLDNVKLAIGCFGIMNFTLEGK